MFGSRTSSTLASALLAASTVSSYVVLLELTTAQSIGPGRPEIEQSSAVIPVDEEEDYDDGSNFNYGDDEEIVDPPTSPIVDSSNAFPKLAHLPFWGSHNGILRLPRGSCPSSLEDILVHASVSDGDDGVISVNGMPLDLGESRSYGFPSVTLPSNADSPEDVDNLNAMKARQIESGDASATVAYILERETDQVQQFFGERYDLESILLAVGAPSDTADPFDPTIEVPYTSLIRLNAETNSLGQTSFTELDVIPGQWIPISRSGDDEDKPTVQRWQFQCAARDPSSHPFSKIPHPFRIASDPCSKILELDTILPPQPEFNLSLSAPTLVLLAVKLALGVALLSFVAYGLGYLVGTVGAYSIGYILSAIFTGVSGGIKSWRRRQRGWGAIALEDDEEPAFVERDYTYDEKMPIRYTDKEDEAA